MLRFKARRQNPALKPQGELTASERRVIRLMDAAMQSLRRDVDRIMTRLADAVAHRSVDQVVNMIPVDPWLDAQKQLQDELYGELLDAGSRVTLPPIQKALMRFSFDRSRPEAAAWASNEAGRLIREVADGQRGMVRDIVSTAQNTGIAPVDVARQIRGGIGLTTAQAGWVDNFYNRSFAQNINAGMTPAQAASRAQAAADRYQTQVHRYRSMTIARTEIMRANSEGRQQAWGQGLAGGWISPNAKKEWNAESDACDICQPLNGVRVGIKDSFPLGEPPAHPNCRCDVLLVEDIPKDIQQMTDAELDAQLQQLLSGEQQQPSAGLPALSPNDVRGLSQFMTVPSGPSRAASFYAETYEGQIAVRRVIANRAAGKPDLDGIDLDEGSFRYMQQAQRYADESSAYTRADLEQDIIASADQIADDLASADATTQTMYRGMRVDDARGLFREGDIIDLDMSSASPNSYVANLYTGADVYRKGDSAVILEIKPGVKAANIDAGRMIGGQAGSNEHLVMGRVRIVSVQLFGDIWKVVVESV